jgi:hypothetical protein
VWDVAAGTEIRCLNERAVTKGRVVSTDGRFLLSHEPNERVVLWPLDPSPAKGGGRPR